MEEFIFGTLATDQLKLMHHRTSRHGIQHHHHIEPRDPEPGSPILLTVRVGTDVQIDHVACYYTINGTMPRGERGHALNGQVITFERQDVQWDTLAWGYIQRWSATIPPQMDGTLLRYQISGWAADGDEWFADWPQVKATAEVAAAAYFRGEAVSEQLAVGDPHQPHTFALSVDRLKPPPWAHDAVIYHIFVDRFFPGQGRDWLQTDDLNGFCGGTLWGVAEKLDYIADLGADTVWLSPVFCSRTHHGYDVIDYAHVEPRLGGDEALRRVVSDAHERGIRVILDIALNHLSNEHPFFVDALNNPASPYRQWFTFDDSALGYRSFFGVPTMPQINAANPLARQWLINVGLFWLQQFDIDGFRLDVADGPGPDFWTDFWTACKQAKPDCFCFGEVVDAPQIQQEYVGRLDGLLDFHTCDALRHTFALRTQTEADLRRFHGRHRRAFPADFLMPTFIDNHDMDRFLFIAQGDKDVLRQAVRFQMSLSNPPVIYYGSEVGITQKVSSRDGLGLHVNRVPMLWGDQQDHELLRFYQQLIRDRRAAS